MGSIARTNAADIAPGKPGNSGPVNAELNNIINNGVNDNDTNILANSADIVTNAAGVAANGAAITALDVRVTALETVSTTVLTHTLAGSFALSPTDPDRFVFMNGTAEQSTGFPNPAALTEGRELTIVSGNPTSVVISGSSVIQGDASSPLSPILLRGDGAHGVVVTDGGVKKWSVQFSRIDRSRVQHEAKSGNPGGGSFGAILYNERFVWINNSTLAVTGSISLPRLSLTGAVDTEGAFHNADITVVLFGGGAQSVNVLCTGADTFEDGSTTLNLAAGGAVQRFMGNWIDAIWARV